MAIAGFEITRSETSLHAAEIIVYMTKQDSPAAKIGGRLAQPISRFQLALRHGRGQQWLRIAIVLLICAIGALRFLHLQADFPNDTPWMIDQAKFTDEGWWTSGAVMRVLTGHWYVPGDYNPAAALPVWPLLIGAVFHFTGVSLVAARALNVSISLVSLGLVYLLVRRFTHPGVHLPALAAVFLLALSPFAFVFCRLAILDTLVACEFCLALLVASYAIPRRIWPLAVLAALVPIMLLTKTTSAALIPAVLWLAWSAMGRKPIAFLRATFAIAVVPAALVLGYAALVAALGYGAAYKYFFQVNAMDDFVWTQAYATFIQFLRNCFWIDRVLFPTAVVILVITVAWKRKLWSNPLFTASWLALAGHSLFIIRRQDDYAPRYFLVMLAPLIWIVVLALDEALARPNGSPQSPHPESATVESPPSASPRLSLSKTHARVNPFWNLPTFAAALLLLAIAASAVSNGIMLEQFVTQPEYQFYDAANSIRQIVRSHPEQKPLILSVSGSQISLMTGIPSINDSYSAEDMTEKLAQYQPGWYLVWTSISSDNQAFLAPYRFEQVASYPVFDDDDRTPLILYKMIRRTP